MIARLKKHLINATLVIASVLLTYVLMEFAVFKVFLPSMPLKIRPSLPDIADVLAQNSKSSYLPHDYVALLGDSYAEGRGDWLQEANGNRAKPFHSANVIHEESGRDVVSFGRGGAGSAEGIVLRPARALPTSQCIFFPALEVPQQIFVYFYEGALDRNFNFLNKVRDLCGRVDAETIDRYLAEQYAAGNPWDCHLEFLDTTIRMAQFLYQYYAGMDLAYCGIGAPRANLLIVGEHTVEAPPLQGPALGLSIEQIRLGMDVLAHSLSWLRHRFEGTSITVVYIPSPLSVYRHAGETEFYCGRGVASESVATAERNSDLMSDLVREIAMNQTMGFMDARPVLRSAATTSVIHGPLDWDHLNEAGYRALGGLIASRVEARPQRLSAD